MTAHWVPRCSYCRAWRAVSLHGCHCMTRDAEYRAQVAADDDEEAYQAAYAAWEMEQGLVPGYRMDTGREADERAQQRRDNAEAGR